MVKVVNEPSPSISKYNNWSPEFKAFVDDCLKKNPAKRIAAEDILTKHKKFFDKAGGPDIEGVPPKSAQKYIVDNLL